MAFRYQYTCDNIRWDEVQTLLVESGMSNTETNIYEKSFKSSYSCIFVFEGEILIGCGRAISDGIRQTAIYDIAVRSDYQGLKIGHQIMQYLMDSTPGCNYILYSIPGKEGFYRKLGLKKMKTGMALFINPERMQDDTYVENR